MSKTVQPQWENMREFAIVFLPNEAKPYSVWRYVGTEPWPREYYSTLDDALFAARFFFTQDPETGKAVNIIFGES